LLPIVNALPGERRGYVDGPAGQIHYREQGQGAPVILIHQGPWSSIQYHRVMPILAAMGLRAIAVDLPGHGMSSPVAGEPSVAAFADCVAAAISALGLEKAMVAGHHGGAIVAARLAAAHPDKVTRLALDNAVIFTAEERAAMRQGMMSEIQDVAPDGGHFTERWAQVRRLGDPEWSDATVHISVVTYFLNGPWKEHARIAGGRHDLAADIPRIVCPTLSVASRKDPAFEKVKRLVEMRPDWEHAEFPGGPAMAFEYPEAWCETIGGFLTRQR
jgi:pimeloyl-ACP methyl ester carboxylesterase